MSKDIEQVKKYYELVRDYLDLIIVGEKANKDVITSAILCDKNSRILLTGKTGTGKTTIAKFLAEHFIAGRISVTSDLLPSDIQGLLKDKTAANFFLLEEFNRASGKVQSSLIELLAENQMTLNNEQIKFNDFYVMGTQNDKEIAGIFSVPHAVYDRFNVNISFGNLTKEEKKSVLFDYKKPERKDIPLQEIVNFTTETVKEYKENLSETDKEIFSQIFFDIVDACRYKGEPLFAGSNLRAHEYGIKLAIIEAMKNGRNHILPSDIANYIDNLYLHRIDQTLLRTTDYEAKEQMETIKEQVLKIKRPMKL